MWGVCLKNFLRRFAFVKYNFIEGFFSNAVYFVSSCGRVDSNWRRDLSQQYFNVITNKTYNIK